MLRMVHVWLGVSGCGYAKARGPRMIPGPQRWTPGKGEYTFAPGARIVVLEPALVRTAGGFAADLLALTGVSVEWVLGGQVRPGDITLGIGPVDGRPEGYRLTVASTVDIQIAANLPNRLRVLASTPGARPRSLRSTCCSYR